MFIADDLYQNILSVMPIPCVDLLVIDQKGRVLLVKRSNEPAKGQWWVPGGRVYVGEMRMAAAIRKLWEECGLRNTAPIELVTNDLILPNGQGGISHAIATLYRIEAGAATSVVLDPQSDTAEWRLPSEWLAIGLHPFVREILIRV